jgi:hypothetical protein
VTGVTNRPVMLSPWLKISFTLRLATCCLNNVYGTVTVDSAGGKSIRTSR